MPRALAILIGISFLGMALFGFGGMHMAQEIQDHIGCAAAVFNGTECPYGNGLFSFAIFHIKAFKSFSMAIPGLFFAVAVFILLAYWMPAPSRALNIVFQRFKNKELFVSSSWQEFIRRLSLYENSPSFFLGIKINP